MSYIFDIYSIYMSYDIYLLLDVIFNNALLYLTVCFHIYMHIVG